MAGRLPSLGQDYAEAHRRYVERLGPDGELWLRTKPFSVRPGHELRECLRIFAHIVERLELDVRAQVLDVGCGPGWLSEFLARCGYWVTGVDVSADMVSIARERIAAVAGPIGEGMGPLAEFHAMPASELPWTNRFDGAVLYDAMHHLDDEVGTLRVIRRALVHGGRIFIHEGVRPEPGSEGERELIAEMRDYGTLESPFDPEYLVAALEEAGFTQVTRFAAVDDLLDMSAPEDELRRVEERLRHPPMNTVIAVNPQPADGMDSGRSFAARIEPGPPPESDGQELSLAVTVTNVGSRFWPAALESTFPPGVVRLAPYVRDETGGRVELLRHALPRSLSPGDSVRAEIHIPRAALGDRSAVEVDLVREGIGWFGDFGSQPLVIPLERRE